MKTDKKFNPNQQKKDQIYILNWLVEFFPNTFSRVTSAIKPLKIGIYDDILDFYQRFDYPPFTKKALRDALSYYSASESYLKCQKEGSVRVDIYGNQGDAVNAEQAQYAILQLSKRANGKKQLEKKKNFSQN